jgi:uncharacterized Zn finger protein
MTVYTVSLVNLKDIQSIQFECSDCSSRLAIPKKQFQQIGEKDEVKALPNKCPHCGCVWWADKTHKDSLSVENTVESLRSGIVRLLKAEENAPKAAGDSRLACVISLGINEERDGEKVEED